MPNTERELKEAAERLKEGLRVGPNTRVTLGGVYPINVIHNFNSRISVGGGGGGGGGGARAGVYVTIKLN